MRGSSGRVVSGICAHEIELADQTIAGSSAADLGGDPAKADPEELFVASVSACHMLWFLDFARGEAKSGREATPEPCYPGTFLAT